MKLLPPRVGQNPRKRDKRLKSHEPAFRNTWCGTQCGKVSLLVLCGLASLVLVIVVPYLVVTVAQL